MPGKAFSARMEYEQGPVVSIQATYAPGLQYLPFQYTAVFESGRVLEASGLDWTGDMVGRTTWLPDGENLALKAHEGEECGNVISFRSCLKDAARRLLEGMPPESTWEDGWRVMLVDHGFLLSERRGGFVEMEEIRESLERRGET
jgi:hypothetical protein